MPDGGETGGSSNTAPGASSTRTSPYLDGVATAGNTSAKIQHTTAPRVIETSTEGSQSAACQFKVQVRWLMILMAMSTVRSRITYVNSSV
ncbi:hypothetical protein DPMN_137221 [Dreissena polymorpha]|uniref:Uncharacterized protein n=1 Tax=Dreissena polymorpha TaxID=45954 RepID=A0A9D4G7E2_DREPO|nr:hypothetical protein DPMN_137221 [Dreissena polymorpha]